jgi:Tfp pilus assembly protein FimV
MSTAFASLAPYVQADMAGRCHPTDRGAVSKRYRRRRLVVLTVVLIAAVGVLAAVQSAAGASGVVTASDLGGTAVSNPAPAPASGAPKADRAGEPASVFYVVQPGDTVWSIARALRPRGDVSGLIAAISAANGGVKLDVGQKLILPR